jgi:carbon monoxide dehydrogenase subunit G
VLALCTALLPTQSWAGPTADDIAVQVDVQDETVRVTVEARLPATPCEVWAVLTDFENLPRYIANIESSKVLSREGNVARVAQTGKTSFGPLTFRFESVRELRLTSCARLESRLVSGNNMKRFQGDTRLEADGSGTGTVLRYRSEAVPETAMPAGIGRAFIESETREHYQDIRREVLRRKSAAPG